MSSSHRFCLTAALLVAFAMPARADEGARLVSYFDDSETRCEPACTSGCSTGCSSCGGWFGGLAGLFDNCQGDPWTLSSYLGVGQGYNLGGWFQSGYHSASNAIGTADVFNKHPDRWNLHQAWAFAEREADGSSGLDWGFRADMIYGVDAADTQAFGNNPGNWDYQNGFDHGIYGWAFPQLYGELAYGDWSVKVGHFFTLVGYEGVTAPDGFFYSHSFTHYNSEPFTHTGVLASYQGIAGLTLYGGWTLGWDTGFDQRNSGNNFLGGFGYEVFDNVTFTYITTAGNFGARSAGGDGYGHSVVMNVALLDNLNYVFQSDMLDINRTDDYDVGVNQYLFYSMSECTRLGGRFEWWKDNGLSHYATTAGVNFLMTPNFRLRPEYRYNWVPGVDESQGVFGIDAIWLY